jgi:hypothetical protein
MMNKLCVCHKISVLCIVDKTFSYNQFWRPSLIVLSNTLFMSGEEEPQQDHTVSYNNKNVLSFRVANEVTSPPQAQKQSSVPPSPRRPSARKVLQLNDVPMEVDVTAKDYRHWRSLKKNLKHIIDQVYHECDVENQIVNCEEAITILQTGVNDFAALIDRIRKQQEYEQVCCTTVIYTIRIECNQLHGA